MDNKRDIEQTKEGESNLPKASKYANPIDFFPKDEGFIFVYKKTEKLATALYMVTNLFGDSEPMKWTLRTKISHLLSFIIGFKDIVLSREEEFFDEVKIKILEIVSLLEIAFRSGLVSPMNFSILKGEFMNLLDFLSHAKKSENHVTDLKENFFEIPRSSMPYKRDNNDIGQNNVLEGAKKTNRQNIIIQLLKKKKELTIKDIAQTIRDCSEKTIQRELISLIGMGVVRKIGERRWSKYSLAMA